MTGSRPAAVLVRGLTWTPLGARTPVLADVDLRLEPGERVLLTGPSGGGAALLLQDPGAGQVAETVGRDIAFGMENRAVPRTAIWPRVRSLVGRIGLSVGQEHRVAALSGGESQRVGLAGSLASADGLLLLDEPTSMLDPDAAARVRDSVADAVADRALTLVVAEHRLDGWLPLVDRLVVVAGGRMVADLPVRGGRLDAHAPGPDGAADLVRDLTSWGVWLPGVPEPTPWPVAADVCAPHSRALVDASAWSGSRASARERETSSPVAGGAALLRVKDVAVARDRPRRGAVASVVHCRVEADLVAGQVQAVLGASGVGKSTLLAALAGLRRPVGGVVEALPPLAREASTHPHRWTSRQVATRVGYVPQRPQASVIGGTCRASLLATARALGRDAERRGDALMEQLGLGSVADRSPYRLSGGEARRLALATAVVHGPDLLLLDEPTVGQDRDAWAAVAGVIEAAARAGVAVVVATHDDLLADLAARRIVLTRGAVA